MTLITSRASCEAKKERNINFHHNFPRHRTFIESFHRRNLPQRVAAAVSLFQVEMYFSPLWWYFQWDGDAVFPSSLTFIKPLNNDKSWCYLDLTCFHPRLPPEGWDFLSWSVINLWNNFCQIILLNMTHFYHNRVQRVISQLIQRATCWCWSITITGDASTIMIFHLKSILVLTGQFFLPWLLAMSFFKPGRRRQKICTFYNLCDLNCDCFTNFSKTFAAFTFFLNWAYLTTCMSSELLRACLGILPPEI